MTETTTEYELKAKLCTKIETIANKIDKMTKDGHNDFSNYSFVSHEAMTARIGELLLENNLSILPECIEQIETEFTTKKGEPSMRSNVTMSFEMIDLETGYSVFKKFFGADNDAGGKSMQQAVTQATKYFYFKTFKVPFGEDGDSKTPESGTKKTYEKSNKPHWNGYNQFDCVWIESDKEKVLARLKAGKSADDIISELEETYQLTAKKKEAIKTLTK